MSPFNGVFLFRVMILPPALLGFLFGRFAVPAAVRAVPTAAALLMDYHHVQNSDHGFGNICVGNCAYIICLVLGLHAHAKRAGKPFWSYLHFDWLILAPATLLMWTAYVRPQA